MGFSLSPPTDAQWTWTLLDPSHAVANIVGGSCPAGANGFDLGAVASPGNPKTNFVGNNACNSGIKQLFNTNDIALGVIRWTLNGVAVSDWSSQKSLLIALDPVVQAMINNIATLQGGGGGPTPNIPSLDTTTTMALDTFVKGCRSDNIWSKMIEVNCVLRIPGGVDNLSLAAMPLLLGPQGAPFHSLLWLQVGFVEANSTANGVVGVPGSGTRMQTNIQPSSTFKGVNNVGASIYISATTTTANTLDFGVDSADGLNGLFFTAYFGGNTTFACWQGGAADGVVAVSPNLPGFYSINRIAANDIKGYFANSTHAFAQYGSNNVLTGNWFTDANHMFVWCCQAASGTLFDFTDRRISFVAFHDGLTNAEAQLLFNRVQALRVALGGGFA